MKNEYLTNLKTRLIVGSSALESLKNVTEGYRKIAVVYTSALPQKFVNKIFACLSGRDFYSFREEERFAAKTLERAKLISDFLSLNGFNRSDIIIAVGGGTICDLAGFVASVYMRGLAHVTVPTIMLCACDACIGGKTAIDAGNIKNGWGAFHQPVAAVVDTDIIAELPDKIFCGGLSEVVKYAAIAPEFFNYLNNMQSPDALQNDLESLIFNCLNIKAKVIGDDIEDKAGRRALNLGHTVAHAIEVQSGYKVPHSVSVAQGVFAESAMSFITRRISEKKFFAIYGMLLKFTPDFSPYTRAQSLIPYMRADKKNGFFGVTFALPTENSVEICRFTEDELKVLLR